MPAEGGGSHSAKAPLLIAGVLLAPVILVFGMVAIIAMGASSLLGGGSTAGTASTAASLGPPVSLAGLHPPRALVNLDLLVAAAPPSEVPCHISASLLLADQSQEDGSWNPSEYSAHGVGRGIGQFSAGTFAEYDHPIPPGGASPPRRVNLVDSVYATARYLCSLGADSNVFDAVVGYNCGHPDAATCPASSSAYASRVLAIANRIAGGIKAAGGSPATPPATAAASPPASSPHGG